MMIQGPQRTPPQISEADPVFSLRSWNSETQASAPSRIAA